MKKYVIFAISFIALFSLLQILSGIFLTVTYTPNIKEAWQMAAHSSDQVIMKGGSPSFTFFLAFLSATAAYFIAEKMKRQEQ